MSGIWIGIALLIFCISPVIAIPINYWFEQRYLNKFMAMSPEERQKEIDRGWEELHADSDWQMR
jgi:hypothetical protein